MFGNKSAELRDIVNATPRSRREKKIRQANVAWGKPTMNEDLRRFALTETYFAVLPPIRGLQ